MRPSFSLRSGNVHFCKLRRKYRLEVACRLAVELLEDRILPATGLGLVTGLTDSSSALLTTGFYYDLIGRAPAAGEVAGWISALQSGVSPYQEALAFTSSAEYQSRVIRDDYWRLLKRSASPSEINGWIQTMETGVSEEQVQAAFLSSSEYYQEQGSDPTNWLSSLYQNVLQRTPSGEELASWNQALQNGVSRATIATGFVNSTEAHSLEVTFLYAQLLGRSPDPAGLTSWVAVMDQGLTASLLEAHLAASPEYAADQTLTPETPTPFNTGSNPGLHFEFASANSPVVAGYTKVPVVNYTPTRGYGWSNIAGIGWRNRNTPDPLTSNLETATDGTFLVDLPAGTYTVTVSLGDAQELHDNVSLWANGTLLASGLTTAASQFIRPSYTVETTSGQLALRIASGGSVNPAFAIDTLDISPASPSSLTLGPAALPSATVNSTYSTTLSAAGGSGIYTFAITSGSLPSWLALNPTTGVLSGTPTTPGASTFTITASDSRIAGLTASQAYTLTVNPARSTPPVVNAGDDVVTKEGTAVPFTGTVTAGTAPYTYAWDFGDGTKASGSLTSTHTYASSGTFTVTLTVTDAQNQIGQSTLRVRVQDVPPRVVINGAPARSPEGTAISLTSLVTSPNSTEMAAGFAYSWTVTKDDAAFASATTPNFNFTPTEHGTYVVTLVATANDNATGAASQTISVQDVPPSVVINGAPASSPEGTTILLTSLVTSPNSTEMAAGFAYSWTVTKDGAAFASATTPNFNFTPTEHGTYVVTLVATANDNATGTASQTISITDVAPVVTISGAPVNSVAGTAVDVSSNIFSPSTTDTAAGFRYTWSVTSNNVPVASGTTANFSFTPADAGTYVVALTVTDSDGATGTDSKSIIVAAPFITTPFDKIPNFGALPTIVSASSGVWSSPNTWSSGRIPGAGDIVSIAEGTTVTYDAVSDNVINTVIVESGAHLIFRTDVTTKLTLLNFLVLAGGELQIGTASNPVAPTVKAEVVFADQPIDTTADPAQYGHGLIALGKVTMYGAVKNQTFVELATEPQAGDTTLRLKQPVVGWQPGDKLLLPDSRQVAWSQAFANYTPEWEQSTLATISSDGTVLTLSAPLQFNHPGARDASGVLDFLPHVADRSGNVIVHSQNPSGTRGYVLFTGRADVNIQNTQFLGLGRTTQDAYDNTTFDANGNVTHVGTNEQGRYPITFNHLIGPATIPADGYQYTFSNNVVLCPLTPMPFRWGIDIDGSDYGLISGNVVYNWAGAGIMTEQGNESFNVIENNFVMRVNGIGLRADYPQCFGLEGSGIWLSGPNNYVRNNIVTDVTGPQSYTYGYILYFGNTGTMAVPAFQGADPSVAGQFIMMNMNATPILQFSGDETYGVECGMTYWEVGCTQGVPNPVGQSVIKDFKVWGFFNLGIFAYQSNNLTIDGFVARGDNGLLQAGSGAYGFIADDYISKNLVLTNADLQSLYVGIQPSSSSGGGTQTIQNSYLRNYIDIQINSLWTSNYRADDPNLLPRVININNVMFDTNNMPTLDGAAPTTIQMNYKGQGFVWNLTQSDQVFVRDYNQVTGDDFQVYYTQQDASFLMPQTTYNPDGTPSVLAAPVASLTNAQAWQQNNVAIAGAVAPSTAENRGGIQGLVNPL